MVMMNKHYFDKFIFQNMQKKTPQYVTGVEIVPARSPRESKICVEPAEIA
jgi:hypothetical protein